MMPMSMTDPDEVESHPEKKPTGCLRSKVAMTTTFVFLVPTYLMTILAYGTPHWFSGEVDQRQTTFGLWTSCQYDYFSGAMGCERINVGRPSQLSFEMRALQMNMTLSILSGFVSFCLYMAWFCNKKKTKGTVTYIAMGLHAFAGLTTVIAVAMFGVQLSDRLGDLSWSYLVACISGGLQTLVGLITLFIMPCMRG